MDKIISLPDSFMTLLGKMHGVFTEPSFFYFAEIIKGILISSRKVVTRFYLIGNHSRHFTDYHRFLNHAQWEPQVLAISILKTVIEVFNIKHLILGLDDTLIPKYGKKIFGRALHFDHAAKVNLAQYIKGHNWVTLGVLQHVAVLKKWICFPFGSELFIPKKERSETDEASPTKIDISITMLKAVKEYFSTLSLTLVADALYAKKKLLQWCIEWKVTMITRLRSDAAIYAPLRKSKTGARGRPAIKGKRLPALGVLAEQVKKFSSLTLTLYGEQKVVSYRQFQAYWKPAGTVVNVVIVKYPQKRGFTTAYFLSTDCAQSVESILTMVAARWSLENAFKDMKQHLGFGAWQCWSERAVVRSVPMTCAAYSTLMLWSHEQVMQFAPTLWDAMPWNQEKDTVSISDILYQLKCQCITKSILSILPKDRVSARKIEQLQELFRIAA
jgi:hypothetical protein